MSDLEVRLPSADDQTKIVQFLNTVGLKPVDPTQPIATPALDLTKTTKKLISWGGAGGAGASIVGFAVTEFRGGSTSIKVAFIVALALILGAAALALARVLDGDVRGRSAVAVAQYEARRQIIAAMLTSGAPAKPTTAGGQPAADVKHVTVPDILAALAAFPKLSVKTAAGEAEVVGQRWTNAQDGLQLKLDDGDWVGIDRIETYTASE